MFLGGVIVGGSALMYLPLVDTQPVAAVQFLTAGADLATFLYYGTAVLFTWNLFLHAVGLPEKWFGSVESESPTDRSRFGEFLRTNFSTLYVATIVLASSVVAVQLSQFSVLLGVLVGAMIPVGEVFVTKTGRSAPLYVLSFFIFLSAIPALVVGALAVSLYRQTPNYLVNAWEIVSRSVEEAIQTDPNRQSIADFLGSLLTRHPGAR